jgi:hypothetical protein
MSAGLFQVIVGVALFTVSDAVPELEPKLASPAKLTATPAGYVPALIPARLALAMLATPEAFVVAFPTEFPLRVKETVFPLTGEPADVNVAERAVVPPYVPVADDTAKDVLACDAIEKAFCSVAVPPTGAEFVTEASRAFPAAVLLIVRLSVKDVLLLTVVAPTVIPVPLILAVLTPAIKLVPVKSMLIVVLPLAGFVAVVGLMLLTVGAGLLTVNAFVNVLVPRFAKVPVVLDTVTLRAPVAAVLAIVILAVT